MLKHVDGLKCTPAHVFLAKSMACRTPLDGRGRVPTPFKALVLGSSPSRPTNKINGLRSITTIYANPAAAIHRSEVVKRVAILPRDLTQEDGELTPTLKVKRAVVTAKHEREIDELYAA